MLRAIGAFEKNVLISASRMPKDIKPIGNKAVSLDSIALFTEPQEAP